MFDVRLKGQHLAGYLQIICAEQMDNDYVLEQKEEEKKSPSGPKNMAGNKNMYLSC